jgi:hypothetical protein
MRHTFAINLFFQENILEKELGLTNPIYIFSIKPFTLAVMVSQCVGKNLRAWIKTLISLDSFCSSLKDRINPPPPCISVYPKKYFVLPLGFYL